MRKKLEIFCQSRAPSSPVLASGSSPAAGDGCECRALPRAARIVRARYRTPHTHSALAAKSSGVAMHTKCKTSEVLNVSNVQRRMERIALTAPTVQLSVKKSAKCVSRLERAMNPHHLSALESRSRAPRPPPGERKRRQSGHPFERALFSRSEPTLSRRECDGSRRLSRALDRSSSPRTSIVCNQNLSYRLRSSPSEDVRLVRHVEVFLARRAITSHRGAPSDVAVRL